MIRLIAFGQANSPPAGTSTNLCPKQTYRYTSPVANDGGSCSRFGGWKVEGGTITADGLNSNNTAWAEVQWDNVPAGKIGNFCGVLTVSINAIAQPKMTGPETVLLCGTSSLTLQATVTSTTNITGYVWLIQGTGVTPTGTVNTTTPQLTLNYTNWVAGSTFSATVAVGTKSSCGFSTPVSPLKTETVVGITIPAIPRTAWVQLSPGNIDNLKVPFNFSPSVICTAGTMTITNQPTGTSVVWSSGNPSALNIDPAGIATRLNNFTGGVSVSATVSNACGSEIQNTTVGLGTGVADPLFEQKTIVCPTTNFYSILGRVTQSADRNASYKWYIGTANRTNFVLKTTSSSNSATIPGDLVDNLYHTLRVDITNTCGTVVTAYQEGRYKASCSGGGGGSFARIFPNPASNQVSIGLTSSQSFTDSFKVATGEDSEVDQTADFDANLYDSFHQLVISGSSQNGIANFNVSNLPNGIYYLQLNTEGKIIRKQVMISK
jgi:Secretion system C-terminal sorting domain